MARTIVIKDNDEKSKGIIKRFNMLAVGLGVSQSDLIIMALEEYTLRHWHEAVPKDFNIPKFVEGLKDENI
ncbi:MAG: hypothetical protein GYA62_16450 [Bacteroidales bacterium]|nr:hypothetical protein [Bacteroidales bacterium]